MYTVCAEISCWINHLMFVKSLSRARGFLDRGYSRWHSIGPPSTVCRVQFWALEMYTNIDFSYMCHSASEWVDRLMGSHLGLTIKNYKSAEPQPSTQHRLCFGNRVSPQRGMNVQMCCRWDSLNWDLAHWYSLWTITMLKNHRAEKC